MEFLVVAQKLWRKLNLRGMIILSLSLQVILIFLAPIRKRRSNWLIMILTWSAYLVADWVADYAFGLIAKTQFNGGASVYEGDAYGDLLAFWAPFLLLHLGGPDTITAFALEDNELWLRHLLNLFFQLGAAGYVFYQSLPNNKLVVPTVLMFIGGIIKYIERTRALYLGSFSKFRGSLLTSADAGPNYAKLMEEFSSKKRANIPASIEMMPEPDLESPVGEKTSLDDKSADAGPNHAKLMEEHSSKKNANNPASIETMRELDLESSVVEEITSTDDNDGTKPTNKDDKDATKPTNKDDKDATKPTNKDDKEVIKAAFFYFTTFKGLLVDLIFSFRERNESMKFFRNRDAKYAFWVIEAELNFFYEVLYTKAAVVHCVTGYLFRAISIGCVTTAFALFYVLNKHQFHEYDIRITYTLLLGAVGLEFVALWMLIFSDWTIALLGRFEKHHIRDTIIDFLLKFKVEEDSRLRRWPKWIEKFLDHISLGELFDDLKSGRQVPYEDALGELIFQQLERKSWATSGSKSDSKHIKEMCAARGKWALENTEINREGFKALPSNLLPKLLPFVHEVDYGESLLLWHIATELCDNDERTEVNTHKRTNVEMTHIKNCHENSKLLSNYMLHLMIKQPAMMSVVAGIGQIRFRDTCAELDKFIDENIFDESIANGNICNIFDGSKTKKSKKIVCKNLLKVPTDVKPVDVKGDRSKSALFDACILAELLLKIEKGDMWKIISQVWVELLGYAAIHCRPYNHAQQLSKGGELVTFVWLLMVQLGLSEQFQIVEGHARAKLIVQK